MESEASKVYELAQGTWQTLKPQLKPPGPCLWVYEAFCYTALSLARKSSIIRKSPTLSVGNHLDNNCPALEAEAHRQIRHG